MRPYHLFFFDHIHYLGSGQFEAENDFTATRRARDLGGNKAVELWQGARKVVLIPGAERKLLSGPKAMCEKVATGFSH